MDSHEQARLAARVRELEAENARLRAGAVRAGAEERAAGTAMGVQGSHSGGNTSGLLRAEVERYGRQLILEDIGVLGQQKLVRARVLVVGAGGLAATIVPLLAGAGVGTLGVVDGDRVALDNLHRQVQHREAHVGMNKAASAAVRVREVNSRVAVRVHDVMLSRENALEIVRAYDVVVDATDNVATRYLINDACVLCDKPLVSGSALGMHGQLSVYHHAGGPCYRCVHPRPPPAHTVTSCSDGGVAGPVPSTIGCLQAMEVLKIVVGCGEPLAGRLLTWDAAAASFRVLRLRPRQASCAVCGDAPTIDHPIDYVQFCGAAAHDAGAVDGEVRAASDVTWADVTGVKGAVLVDVRAPVQFAICSVPGSHNVPLATLSGGGVGDDATAALRAASADGARPVYLVCRRGVDSRAAVPLVAACLGDAHAGVFNVVGGLVAYHHTVDARMPLY